MTASPDRRPATPRRHHARVGVLLVDKNTPTRKGLEVLLNEQVWVDRCLTAENRESAAEAALRFLPQVAIVNIDSFIATTVAQIRAAHADTEIILLARCAGSGSAFQRRLKAAAYLPPAATIAEIVETARAIVAKKDDDRRWASRSFTFDPEKLTHRELQVLTLMSTGATNREIAEELYLGTDSIKKYAASIYRKLGVRNRTEASQQILSGALSA